MHNDAQAASDSPEYRISEGGNAATYSGSLDDQDFVGLLTDQCGAGAETLANIRLMEVGDETVIARADGVHFKVERIQ